SLPLVAGRRTANASCRWRDPDCARANPGHPPEYSENFTLITIDPSNCNTNRTILQIMACGNPWPITSLLNEACAHWIQMHVIELLFYFLARVQIKYITPRLPNRLVG